MTKDSFMKVFSNLPINLRKEVILVLKPEGPITWEVAYLEIKQDTKLGKQILEKLSDMEII